MILFIDFVQTDVGTFFLEPKPIEINGERQINETDSLFILNYTKSSEQNEMLYIFYDVEEPTYLDIECSKSSGRDVLLRKNGAVDYLLTQTDEYLLFFNPLTAKGKFKIASSGYEFTVDAKEELFIPKSNYKDFHNEIIFSVINIDKSYLKLFSSKDELKNIVSYSKKDSDFVPMENSFFLFEKGESLNGESCGIFESFKEAVKCYQENKRYYINHKYKGYTVRIYMEKLEDEEIGGYEKVVGNYFIELKY
jgi:hypothetical protein